ncbi:hypothetical protein ETH_00015620 [Eimeria tenella]|uniref:DUF7630 domain-containing protein n=1 Tax=Eimeria tenella TaxID=5802 RepID=U6L3T6_EIMTE|nr:hypothetical protein ETH_00015620 [Eimeria tenella]CDJ43868.1 hypothetical protein ETH_00015620 [Eimeria tenella]|eukprot:XP_013234617.1 hypothetical protein ETH_00015620 [Eimeria tenella]
MGDFLCSECKEGFSNNFESEELCTVCPQVSLNGCLLFLYYLGLLLFNIVMAYLNVSAGFNRRSIHSIVIKIASNFVTCMWVFCVIDLETLGVPSWFLRLQTDVQQQMSVSQKSRWLSIDCLLRSLFSLSYSETYFYSMLFYLLLPLALPAAATLLLYLLVSRLQQQQRSETQRKLLLLQQTQQFQLLSLSQQLREKLEEDRLFLMFRYVSLPEETLWRRLSKFLEDMTPVFVTIWFFIYTSTSRNMLSLLKCTGIEFGDTQGGTKFFLAAAMSMQCQVSPRSPYLPFFLLGVVGLLLWSVGIPLGAFLVLFVNRKNLNSKQTRLKFGFLHNGFVRQFWFWETVVFARKLAVLVVSSTAFFVSKSLPSATVAAATALAIAFNILHLKCQPFDKRQGDTSLAVSFRVFCGRWFNLGSPLGCSAGDSSIWGLLWGALEETVQFRVSFGLVERRQFIFRVSFGFFKGDRSILASPLGCSLRRQFS